MHRGQPLCKNISHLGICANKTDDELLTSYMLPNKVEVDLNVLGVHVENRIHYQINNKQTVTPEEWQNRRQEAKL